MTDFNSIKVRLKLPSGRSDELEPEFQFHKGTIKTCGKQPKGEHSNYFNSIKVRLKQVILQPSITILIDFNSIKVRLKQDFNDESVKSL